MMHLGVQKRRPHIFIFLSVKVFIFVPHHTLTTFADHRDAQRTVCLLVSRRGLCFCFCTVIHHEQKSTGPKESFITVIDLQRTYPENRNVGGVKSVMQVFWNTDSNSKVSNGNVEPSP